MNFTNFTLDSSDPAQRGNEWNKISESSNQSQVKRNPQKAGVFNSRLNRHQ